MIKSVKFKHLALLAVLVVATSCTSAGPTGGPSVVSSAAATPRAGGKIVWAKVGEVTRLDPSLNGGIGTWDVTNRIYETLVNFDQAGTLQPWLATSWERPSETSYVFHLRRGVRFSNGREMNADDVVTTLTRAIDATRPGASYAVYLSDVAKVEAIDPYTVRIGLNQPSSTIVPALAAINTAIIPAKELNDGTFDPTKDLLGTGPFMLKEHKENESWTLVRNPDYWRADRPFAGEVRHSYRR